MGSFTKTQVDRLGERLREGSRTEEDLTLLDEYRLSFSEPHQIVLEIVTQESGKIDPGQEITSRAKTSSSIIEKLRREHCRLTQIQDIAGIRVVMPSLVAQEWLVAQLTGEVLMEFGFTRLAEERIRTLGGNVPASEIPLLGDRVIDRRKKPSHGYRAVHIIADIRGKHVEIQIRSRLQDAWAELSEKCADHLDPSIKYGGGENWIRDALDRCSSTVARMETEEGEISERRVRAWVMNTLNLSPQGKDQPEVDKTERQNLLSLGFRQAVLPAAFESVGRIISDYVKIRQSVLTDKGGIYAEETAKLMDEMKRVLAEMESTA